MVAIFVFYCITTYGQYVMVEAPTDTVIDGGDLSLMPQRVGVISTSTIERFEHALRGIYTGYAYICGGGIHYVKSFGSEPLIFTYGDYDVARRLLSTLRSITTF